MFRTPSTRVLLSDYEIFQTIHTICIQRLRALSLAYDPPLSEEDEDESEAEFHQISLSTSYTRSSSVQPEDDRRACDVLDTNIYISSSKSDSDDLPAYSAESHTLLNAHSTNSGETYQSEDILEIPESQISSTPQESSTDTTPPATIIFSPRSPEPYPRPCTMHRSVYYGNFPVLQVQVPEIYECMPDMVLADVMSGSASYDELAWQVENSAQFLQDVYSHLPLRRDQHPNWSWHMLAQPPKENSSTAIIEAQSVTWSKENTCPRTHRRPAKKSSMLEVTYQIDEVD